MDLLFRRSQSGDADTLKSPLPFSLGAPSFKLWAKIELTPDEQKIVNHYRFDKALLIEAIQPELLKSAGGVGFGAALLSMMLLSTMFAFDNAMTLTLRDELAERGIRTHQKTVWLFVHAEGLSFKKNRAADGTVTSGYRPKARALESVSAQD